MVALPSLSAPLKGCADQVRQAVKALTDVVEAITHDMDTGTYLRSSPPFG